jgi:hypothetical protein
MRLVRFCQQSTDEVVGLPRYRGPPVIDEFSRSSASYGKSILTISR